MRKLRLLVLCFFGISCIVFGTYRLLDWAKSDKNMPEIHFEEDIIYVSASATEAELLAGVTATDVESGDLTDKVQVASMSPMFQDHQRTIQYIVFDDANQLGTATRTVVYTDYNPPRIYIKEPLRFYMKDYMTKLEHIAVEAQDMIDGDLTNRIKTTWGDLWYEEGIGDYPFVFQVNNSAGDTCILEVEINLVDDADEENKFYPMLKDYVVYTKVGKTLNFQDYLSGVQWCGAAYGFGSEDLPIHIIKRNISIHPEVDYSVPGTYPVDYSYTTRDNVTAVTTLYVVVEE